MQGMRPATELLHDEQCNPAGPNPTIRHNHVNKISLIWGLETLPGAQVSNEPTIGVSSRRNDIRLERQNCFRLTRGADYGGGGAVTDFDVTVVSPRQRPARYSQPCPEPIPTYRRKSSLKSNCAPSRIENIKTRWLGCLPKETLGRPSTTPLHYGRVNRRRDMGHHNRVEGEFLSGRLQLHDEADVGGIVEGAWENVYAGIRHVGSFVVYYPSQRS